jgi:hypothetical protein
MPPDIRGWCVGRVANVANGTNIPLQDVTYQYWFNGPDGVTAFDTSSPMDLFELQCSDATTGQCGWTAFCWCIF